MTLLSGGKRVYVTPQYELQTIFESPVTVAEPEAEALLVKSEEVEPCSHSTACLPSLLGFWVDIFYEPMVGERQSRV